MSTTTALATLALAVVLIVVAIWFLLGAVFWLVAGTSLPGQLAEIEQLRRDAANVDPAQAEDVIGQVTAWNQAIASYQAYNDTWWAALFVPDEWDRVMPIEVPQ